ncbi:MAG: GspH/FimT family protein [Gammaproteobacteria bacterium]|nr:GspH/FimT family protein [Gammaproteobacteria bacterium]MCP5200329.1 GspH/FimT family protein [Gammaproteobacteria bacterium]
MDPVSARRHAAARGFTLLEVLVAVVILAVLAGLVTPMLGDGRARAVSDAGERFVALLNQAREESVLSGRWWRLDIDPAAGVYRFAERIDGAFAPVTLEPLAGDHALAGIAVQDLAVNGEAGAGAEGIVLLPSGEQDALRVAFVAGPFRQAVVLPPFGAARLDDAP